MNSADAKFLDAIPVTPQDVEDEELRQDLRDDPRYLSYLDLDLELYDDLGDPEEGVSA